MSYKKKRKNTFHYMRYTNILHEPPKIMEEKTHLNTSTVKLPVTSRVNPPSMKNMDIVEKYDYSRCVIYLFIYMVSLKPQHGYGAFF